MKVSCKLSMNFLWFVQIDDGGKSAESADSDDEKLPEEKYLEKLAKEIPQGTDKTPEVLSGALQGLSDRWRNWVIRGFFTWLMLGLFGIIIYLGPLALMVTVRNMIKESYHG